MRHSSLRLFLGLLSFGLLFLSAPTLTSSRLSAQEVLPAELPVTGVARAADSASVRRSAGGTAPATGSTVEKDRSEALESGRGGKRAGVLLDSADEEPRIPLRIDWRLLVGGAVPVGEFGEQDGRYPGFARPGFSAGVDYVLGAESLGWINSFIVSMNPSDPGSAFRAAYVGLELPEETTIDVGPWYTLWGSTGFQYAIAPVNSARMFATGQVGVLLSRSSDVTLSVAGIEMRQAASWTGTLAFSFGLGVEVADRVVISGRYMMSTPTYDLDLTGPTRNLPEDLPGGLRRFLERLPIHNLYDQPTSILQILAGISF